MRLLGKLGRLAAAVAILAVVIPVLGLAWGFATTGAPVAAVPSERPPQEIAERLRADIPGYERPEESTFLTYPEWAIVYAARDYAELVSGGPPHAFAYWGSVSRFWQDYATVIRATSGYPFNVDNHLMLVVIGVSHTVEHAVQWAYENTLGRLTGFWFPTPEDAFQATGAADYAAFLDQTPWYRFDYAGKRAGLWDERPAEGLAAIRSWERKIGFGLSYTIKQAYADLIASGLSATQDPAALEIYVWAKGPVAEALSGEQARIVADLGPDGAVFVTGRYQRFTELVPRLAARGVEFVEIGGNGVIFATCLSDGPPTSFEGAATLFSDPLPSRPEVIRTGLVIPVARLHEVLPALKQAGLRLEHLYDY